MKAWFGEHWSDVALAACLIAVFVVLVFFGDETMSCSVRITSTSTDTTTTTEAG